MTLSGLDLSGNELSREEGKCITSSFEFLSGTQRGAGLSAQPALGITWERGRRWYKEGTRKEMRTRTEPSWVFNSLNPSSTCKSSQIPCSPLCGSEYYLEHPSSTSKYFIN